MIFEPRTVSFPAFPDKINLKWLFERLLHIAHLSMRLFYRLIFRLPVFHVAGVGCMISIAHNRVVNWRDCHLCARKMNQDYYKILIILAGKITPYNVRFFNYAADDGANFPEIRVFALPTNP